MKSGEWQRTGAVHLPTPGYFVYIYIYYTCLGIRQVKIIETANALYSPELAAENACLNDFFLCKTAGRGNITMAAGVASGRTRLQLISDNATGSHTESRTAYSYSR